MRIGREEGQLKVKKKPKTTNQQDHKVVMTIYNITYTNMTQQVTAISIIYPFFCYKQQTGCSTWLTLHMFGMQR